MNNSSGTLEISSQVVKRGRELMTINKVDPDDWAKGLKEPHKSTKMISRFEDLDPKDSNRS